jgi:hypothetical protein
MEKRIRIKCKNHGKKILWDSTLIPTPEYPHYSAGETANCRCPECGDFSVKYAQLVECKGDTYFYNRI